MLLAARGQKILTQKSWMGCSYDLCPELVTFRSVGRNLELEDMNGVELTGTQNAGTINRLMRARSKSSDS